MIKRKGSFTDALIQSENKVLKEQGLKKCRACLEIQPLTAFMTSGGKLKYPTCPNCRSDEQRTYWNTNPQFHEKRYSKEHQRKQLLAEVTSALKTAGCADCKRYIPDAMEFDHTCPPEEKTYEINMIYKAGGGKDFHAVLLAELAKGEYVCGNCHRKRTESRNPSQRTAYLSNPYSD